MTTLSAAAPSTATQHEPTSASSSTSKAAEHDSSLPTTRRGELKASTSRASPRWLLTMHGRWTPEIGYRTLTSTSWSLLARLGVQQRAKHALIEAWIPGSAG